MFKTPQRRALLRVEMFNKHTWLQDETHFQVKMDKTHYFRSTFGSWDVEKVHIVVARTTCTNLKGWKTDGRGPFLDVEMWEKCTALWREVGNQNAENTTCWDHFCWLKCRKVRATVARSTFTTFGWTIEKVHSVGKMHILRPLLVVEMSTKCMPLRHEAHMEVKMLKTPHVGTTFAGWNVEKCTLLRCV